MARVYQMYMKRKRVIVTLILQSCIEEVKNKKSKVFGTVFGPQQTLSKCQLALSMCIDFDH